MSTPAQDSSQFPPSEHIAERYRVLRQIGAGGMGEAYLADDTLLHRQVVIKRMAPQLAANESDRKRFLSEAKRAAAINNPHVVQIYDALDVNGQLLLVLEYVDGTQLRRARSGKLPLDDFFHLALQIADGVAAAHASHVIHCDLKPENILITKNNRVKVLDFGLARATAQQDGATVSLTEPKFAGTPGYMPPEMVRENAVDERSDIFTLGVVFYEMLTGISPFRCPTLLDTLQKTLHDAPSPASTKNPAVPLEIDWILDKMLAKSPDERYSSMHDVITDLTACQRKLLSGTTHTSLPTITPKPQSHRLQWFLAAALVLLVVAFLVYRVQHTPPPPPQYRSVAVLPFKIITASKDSEARVDGICVTLTSKLASIANAHHLHVTPASEVRRRLPGDASAAREQLGADLVFEGEMQQAGNAVRITYALIDTSDMSQVRSDIIDGTVDDPFSLENKIVDGALNMLDVQLAANERQSIGRRGTNNAAAYDLFLTGSGYLREYVDSGNIDRAIDAFQRALLKDANYAAADAALGRAYWQKYESNSDASLVDLARNACEAALRSDPSLPDSHLCLGIVANGRGEYETAAQELEAVISAQPNNDIALRELASVYESTGQPARAEQVYKLAIAAQPNYWAGYSNLGHFYSKQSRYEDAASQFRIAIDHAPRNVQLYYSLGGIFILQGKNTDAVQELKKAVELQPNANSYRNLGQAYLHMRDFENAIEPLKQAVALEPRQYSFYSSLADAYAWSKAHAAEAPATYRKSIELALVQQKVNPRNPDVNIMLAYNYAALADEAHALEYLKKAQQEAPNDSELMFFAARINARLNHPEDAAQWLLKAIANGYSKADIRGCPDLDAILSQAAVKQALGN